MGQAMTRRSGPLGAAIWVAAVTCLAAPAASAAELLIYDSTFTFETPCVSNCGLNDGTAHGYYEVPTPADAPPDWTTPDNYQTGQWYVRFEVLSQATNRNSRMQVCVWQSDTEETCSTFSTLTGPGSVVTANSSPTTWWIAGDVDFSNPSAFQGIGSPLWIDGPCSDGSSATAICDWASPDCCWIDRSDYFPMTVRMIVVAVSEGSTFSGWDHYVSPPATPLQISITSPAEGATFLFGEDIPITATATGGDSAITEVEFYADAASLGVDSTPPFAHTWTSAPTGNHTILARVTNETAQTAEDTVAITVSDQGEPTPDGGPENDSGWDAGGADADADIDADADADDRTTDDESGCSCRATGRHGTVKLLDLFVL
jgi:hypothetical protein